MNIRSLFSIPGKKRKAQIPFDLLFKRFRDVLHSHNKALEIITEMGEKLGGEYLFDVVYLRNAYSRLFNIVQDTVQYFEALTQNGYPKLREAVKRIDDRITGVIYDLPPASGKDIVFLEDITWDMSREVGGKNAGLAEVKNSSKLNVPAAFAITTHAYDQFLEYNKLSERIDAARKEADVGEEILAGLRKAILTAGIPPLLDSAIDSALRKMALEHGKHSLLAIRSSAEEEDSEFSFAGQFQTVLNVPLESGAVKKAYKEVIASLFSAKAIAYQKSLGYGAGRLKMAVVCMEMVEALSSGVIYTVSPGGDKDRIMIRATWGLGSALVEGQVDSDLYLVNKPDLSLAEQRIAFKETTILANKQGGSEKIKTAPDVSHSPCLTPTQTREISGLALSLERYFRKPLDIEWAINKKGEIYILQARPLALPETKNNITAKLDSEHHQILMENRGETVMKGVSAGRVFVVRHMDEIEKFPKGAVLVAANDSSNFVRIMPYASAIITDTGSPASHMSSISREFRVPTLVNTGNATKLLKHGQEVTIGIGDDGSAVVYEGIVKGLLNSSAEKPGMERLFEYRKKRYVLKYVSPLNLIDPLTENFTPDKCKTLHDVLRFVHEKAVSELVENAANSNSMLKKQAAIRLNLQIPAGIMVVDIGGALKRSDNSSAVSFENISSAPLRALIGGMLQPGVWHSEAVPLRMNDFLSSMMRMSDITSSAGEYAGYNVAVASAEYVNLSLRFGYHFNMLDCYCSQNAMNNHIYFRFVGGATDIVKRTRRVELIAAVLTEFGFTIRSRGDLITARLANIGRDEMLNILDQLGRLIAYTRQLDAVLHDPESVERRTRDFLEQKYG